MSAPDQSAKAIRSHARTTPKIELRGVVQSCVVYLSYRKPSNGAGFSPISNYSATELLSPLSSLQVVDCKEENELRNYSPLRGQGKRRSSAFPAPWDWQAKAKEASPLASRKGGSA